MQKIKLGISICLTGRYSLQGKETFGGIDLWVNEVNQSGGIFVKDYNKKLAVELIFIDDESSIDKCKVSIEHLILNHKVDLLLGPYSSAHMLSAASIAEEYNKIIWNHGGASDEIVRRNFKYVINAITSSGNYLNGIIEMVSDVDKKANKIAIFQAQDSGFSTNVAKGAKSFGEINGFKVYIIKYISGTNDFSPHLKNVDEIKPDLILGVGRLDDDINLAKQMIKQELKPKMIGLVVCGISEFQNELGKDAEGFLGPSQWEKGLKTNPDIGPTPLEFFNKFKKTYGKPPDYPGAQAYNIGLIIEKCIQDSGALQQSELREAARNADFKTFYGRFKIDPETGNQIGHKMVVVQWQKGNKVIVYPREMAEAKPVYPFSIRYQ